MEKAIPLSVLDLASVQEGKTIADAFRNTVALAQHTEKLGYRRFWMAEHHNLPGIASAATSVLLGHVAGKTSTIRVGSGGIMLPNHSPLVIAEQFGTLETLYPGRIDLGLGRAPGSDQVTMRAVRRVPIETDFGELVEELQSYFLPTRTGQKVAAIPGAGLPIPLWILGSSLYSAELAARLGLPYAFAGHFAPDMMMQAFAIYHREFFPSKVLSKPQTMVCVQGIAAETDEKAQFLATTLYQRFLGIIRNDRSQSKAPVENMDAIWSDAEKHHIHSTFRYAVIGGPERVKQTLRALVRETRADEVMICSELYALDDRLRSFEILAEQNAGLN